MKSLLLAAAALTLCGGAFASTPDLPSCDVWQLACNWTNASRETDYNINRVVIHKTQGGTAAGASSWFANCGSGASAHFCFDKSNGYCYQNVYEADIAWHAGYWNTNANSVGIEHSGWVANNDTSTACYNESGLETRSCRIYYAVPGNRSYVIGHSEVPGCSGYGGGTGCHTDPGGYWNWSYYMGRVNASSATGAKSGAVASLATDKFDFKSLKSGSSVKVASTYGVPSFWAAEVKPAVATRQSGWELLGTLSL